MRDFRRFPRPNDKLRGIGKIAAGDIRWWIGLCPCYDIQDLEAQFCQYIGNGKNIVVGPANPDCPVIFQFLTTFLYPRPVERIHVFRRSALVPFTFIHAHDFPALHAYPAIAQEIPISNRRL